LGRGFLLFIHENFRKMKKNLRIFLAALILVLILCFVGWKSLQKKAHESVKENVIEHSNGFR
jgi:predicted negative regulator of RcsB-dependent stress response